MTFAYSLKLCKFTTQSPILKSTARFYARNNQIYSSLFNYLTKLLGQQCKILRLTRNKCNCLQQQCRMCLLMWEGRETQDFCVSTGSRHHCFNPNHYTGKYCVSLYYLLHTTLTHHCRHLFFSFCNGIAAAYSTIYVYKMYDSSTE